MDSGGAAADLLFNWKDFTNHVWVVIGISICGACYTILGFFPYLDNFGHFFGIFAGFLLTTCFLMTHEVCPPFVTHSEGIESWNRYIIEHWGDCSQAGRFILCVDTVYMG